MDSGDKKAASLCLGSGVALFFSFYIFILCVPWWLGVFVLGFLVHAEYVELGRQLVARVKKKGIEQLFMKQTIEYD